MICIDSSIVLVIDVQSRLTPSIHKADAMIATIRRLLDVTAILGVPVLLTEENAKGLGSTVAELHSDKFQTINKMSFDACQEPDFLDQLMDRRDIVIVGCEAQVCVLQTALGLCDGSRRVFVVRDAVGSRHPEDMEAALSRMERNGVELVTSEMVIFEWLGTAKHPRFHEVLKIVK